MVNSDPLLRRDKIRVLGVSRSTGPKRTDFPYKAAAPKGPGLLFLKLRGPNSAFDCLVFVAQRLITVDCVLRKGTQSNW